MAFFAWAMHDCDACHAGLRRGPRAWHFPLPATRDHSTYIIKPMFVAILCMYDLMHCIHVHLTYSLCVSHTG